MNSEVSGISWRELVVMTRGEVAACGGGSFNYGQSVADYLAATLAELVRTEYLELRRATPSGQQQVCVTDVGQIGCPEPKATEAREACHDDR